MNICMCLYSRQFIKSKYLLKVKYFKVNDVKYKLNFKMMITKTVSVHIDHNENIAHFLDIWIRIFKFYNVELLGEGPDSSPSVELCIVFFSDIIYIHVIQLFEI